MRATSDRPALVELARGATRGTPAGWRGRREEQHRCCKRVSQDPRGHLGEGYGAAGAGVTHVSRSTHQRRWTRTYLPPLKRYTSSISPLALRPRFSNETVTVPSPSVTLSAPNFAS